MKLCLKAALVALAFVGAPMVANHPASAQVAVVINTPGIAFGYADGYWDRNHAWHTWKSPEEAARFRAENHDHYYDYKHDREGDGWREKETWWDREHDRDHH